MKFRTHLLVDVGVVLVAGLGLALSGGPGGAVTKAALSAPLAAMSPPGVVVTIQAPGAGVGGLSLPLGARSLPAGCVDIRTPASHISVGDASAPHCVIVRTGPVGGSSVPLPVGDASPPRCVVVETPASSVRAC